MYSVKRDVGVSIGEGRIVCYFSCGTSSAVATKLAISDYGPRVVIFNAYIQEEHEDNQRFLADCQRWFGEDYPIRSIGSVKYKASIREVWRRKRYIKGQFGAPCSTELKRNLLDSVAQPTDTYVLGYTFDEQDRLDQFRDHNPHTVICPLIDRQLTKADCHAIIERAGIELPAMYRLGFNNDNCKGCPKGGAGYWNKIREVFPVDFYETADIQETLGPGAKFLRNRRTGERIYLRELDPTHGRIEDEPEISCSFFCAAAERVFTK